MPSIFQGSNIIAHVLSKFFFLTSLLEDVTIHRTFLQVIQETVKRSLATLQNTFVIGWF